MLLAITIKWLLAIAVVACLAAITVGLPLGCTYLAMAHRERDRAKKYQEKHMGMWMLAIPAIAVAAVFILYVFALAVERAFGVA